MKDTQRAPARAPLLSVIVPTFDRPAVLSTTLDHLAAQTLAPADYEVVVVDDGSEAPLQLDAVARPFRLNVVRLEHAGAAEARNAGARRAAGDLLVFVDDDIALAPDALEAIRDTAWALGTAVFVGSISERRSSGDAAFHGTHQPMQGVTDDPAAAAVSMPFAECMTGFLAVPRSAFDRLGGFQDPTGAWPSWDDVDFGYRAHRAGLALRRVPSARAIHRDAAQSTLDAASDRWYRAARSAVRLFQRYPELEAELAMFRDKSPIDWRRDGVRLVLRKIARRALATRPATGLLRGVRRALLTVGAPRSWSDAIAAWVVRGAMVHGYRAGLRDLRASKAQSA